MKRRVRVWLCNLLIRFIDWGEREFGYESRAEWDEGRDWRAKFVTLRDGR